MIMKIVGCWDFFDVFDQKLLKSNEEAVVFDVLSILQKFEAFFTRKDDVDKPYVICSDWKGFQTLQELASPFMCGRQTIYSHKKKRLMCNLIYLSEMSLAMIEDALYSTELIFPLNINIFPLPIVAKIHDSALDFIAKGNTSTLLPSTPSSRKLNEIFTNVSTSEIDLEMDPDKLILSFELSHCNDDSEDIGGIQSSNDSALAFIKSITGMSTKDQDKSKSKSKVYVIDNENSTLWDRELIALAHKYSLFVDIEEEESNMMTNVFKEFGGSNTIKCIELPECPLPPSAHINVGLNSIEISGIHADVISSPCFAGYVHRASLNPHVLRIAVHPAPTLNNFEARGIVETNHMHSEPYTNMGLNGQGQVVGVADSGVNDLSCFFIDDSGEYASVNTDRNGTIERNRRKIIQYIAFADELDITGGHGTHVCASILGESLGDFSAMDGIAPKAKLTFFDIGVTETGALNVPPVHKIFQSAYAAGARVHSNSWGSFSNIYSSVAQEVDHYTYSHPDFLAIFAAGNSGSLGFFSVITPGNAKNSLAVGALQLRDIYSDALLGPLHENIASFSSIGPTLDGRIKPDIVAPGDFIMSAYAGDSNSLRTSIESGINTENQCAVHQMSGTSMSTPIVAGCALLIRQYFMDPNFWEKLCNKKYSFCYKGSFTPTGYFLKALILHSGSHVLKYSVQANNGHTVIPSSYLGPPPDYFQGYGRLLLSNILPLPHGKGGLDSQLDLVVFDKLPMAEHSTIAFEVDFSLFISEFDNSSAEKDQKHEIPSLKITIAWYDPPSTLSSVNNLLLHDVDLLVLDPDGNRFWGNMSPSYTDIQDDDDASNSSKDKPEDDDSDLSDDTNTNEQVFIIPQCQRFSSTNSCIYRVLIHCNSIYATASQDIAVIITTAGLVSGPMTSFEWEDIVKPPETIESKPQKTSFLKKFEHNKYIGSMEEDIDSNFDFDKSSTKEKLIVDHKIVVPLTSLGTRIIVGTGYSSIKFSEDSVTLEEFQHLGRLDSATMHIHVADSKIPFSAPGTDAFLIAVIISSPAGLVAQIGGFDYLKKKNKFYRRMWPFNWISQVFPQNSNQYWVSTRDLHAANLTSNSCSLENSTPKSSQDKEDSQRLKEVCGNWTVEIASGYTLGVRSPRNYSGHLVLSFEVTADEKAELMSAANKIITRHNVNSNGSRHLEWSLLVALSLIALTVAIIVLACNKIRIVSNFSSSERKSYGAGSPVFVSPFNSYTSSTSEFELQEYPTSFHSQQANVNNVNSDGNGSEVSRLLGQERHRERGTADKSKSKPGSGNSVYLFNEIDSERNNSLKRYGSVNI